MTEQRIDRILSEQEINQLKDLLVPSLKDEYPNFEQWLAKASDGITDGSRIAIGIWKESLIAASIVKMTAGRTAELKSFFIDPNFRNTGYGDDLYKMTEEHCRKSGLNVMVTDVYCSNTAMVEFLISKGYSIGGRLDMYGNGRQSYVMSKELVPEYLGDPFDWEELGEWFLNARLGATSFSNHPEVGGRRFDRKAKVVVNDCEIDLLVEIKDQRVDRDPVQILHKECAESEYHLPVFIAREFTNRAERYADENGILVFDAIDISKVLGRCPERFREGPIGGMIVGVKSEYLEPLIKSKPPTVYVKGGPSGKYLKEGDLIAFYSTHPHKEISALGVVASVDIGTPAKIWESHREKIVFTEDQFQRFAKLKRSVLAIVLSSIWKIEPVRGEELDAIVPKKDRGSSYMDLKTVALLKKRAKTKKSR